jgi:hypothetical protein
MAIEATLGRNALARTSSVNGWRRFAGGHRLRNGRTQWLAAAILLGSFCSAATAQPPGTPLRIVIIRHAEKPDDGDNLSCKGQNRAAALPAVLEAKFGKPSRIYVPALKLGKSTRHARMYQTAVPYAVKFNLPINTSYEEDEIQDFAEELLGRSGLLLVIWQHSQIQPLARALGVQGAPRVAR